MEVKVFKEPALKRQPSPREAKIKTVTSWSRDRAEK
jgi:hypothetical protein